MREKERYRYSHAGRQTKIDMQADRRTKERDTETGIDKHADRDISLY